MKIYFGGDSFLYGYGLNRKDSLPHLMSKNTNSNFLDESQSESSNKLIYLRAINNLMSIESCDFYLIPCRFLLTPVDFLLTFVAIR